MATIIIIINNGVPLRFITSMFLCAFFLLFVSGGVCSESVPGLYVFGDSLVDVGNNNYLSNTILKADFPHNGVDFPTGNATGRFSNGKNAADFLAEKVGLPSAPPYLSLISTDNKLEQTNATVTGVNFASGGAGILNETNEISGSISLPQQLDYYSLVHDQLVQQLGSTPAQNHLAKSLFLVVIGSNDLLDYFNKDSNVAKQYTPSQYVHLMASTLKHFIKRLYGLGARKFVVTGVGVIGCCPEQRMQNNDTSRCNEEANYWSTKYNIRLKSLLKELKLESHDLTHSYFATYRAMNDLIRDPQSYGIVEIKEACCGLGTLNADMPCLPISNVCSNRSDYLFWDLYHPTEMVSRMFADLIYHGSPRFTLPVNVEHLVHMSYVRQPRSY